MDAAAHLARHERRARAVRHGSGRDDAGRAGLAPRRAAALAAPGGRADPDRSSPASGSRRSTSARSSAARRARRPRPIDWLARAARRRLRAFSRSGVSTDERGRIEALLARAEALTEAHRYDEAVEALRVGARATSAHDRLGRARGARALRRGAGRRLQDGDAREAVDAAARRARARRGPAVLRRRPGRHPLPARRLPLQALEHRDRGGALRRGARARRAPRSCRATCSGPTSSAGARAAAVASATSRRRARTSSTRSSSRRASTTAASSRTRTSRRRSSPSGWVTGSLSRNYAQQAKALYEELERRAQRRPPDAQPRRSPAPARQARAGDRAPEGVLRARRRGRVAAGRRAGARRPRRRCTCTSATTTRPTRTRARRSRCSRGARTSCDEIGQSQLVLGRSLLERGRARRGGGVLRGRGRRVRADGVRQPPGGGVGRAGRPRESSWGRPRGSASVPERRRGAPGHPVLRKEDTVMRRGSTAPAAGQPRAPRRRGSRKFQPAGDTWSDGH